MRLSERKLPRAGAPQGAHAAAAAEGGADIVAERADIGALGAADAELNVARVVPTEALELVDRNAAGLSLHLTAAAGDLVELFSADLDRRIHGRQLVDLAAKACERGVQRGVGDVGIAPLQHGAGGILRVRRDAEAQPGEVFLLRSLGELHSARGAAEKHGEQPGRHRVERSGVTHALFVQRTAQLGADIHARPAGGLVDE